MLRVLPLHLTQETYAAQRPSALSSKDPSPSPSVYSSHERSKPVQARSVPARRVRLGLLHGLVDVGRQASGVVCSNDLTAGLEVPRSTPVPQPRRLVDGVQVLADADVALATALDRRVVGRARDGVVILGRGVTVLRCHVWAMSAPWCHLGSFRLVPTASSLSGAPVYCGY